VANAGGATGYALNGNISSFSDLQTGSWTLGYDHLNRLQSATAASGIWNGMILNWVYDSFGNRKTQTLSANPPGQAMLPPTESLMPTNNNQIGAAGYSYDAAGHLTSDGAYQYAYDAEGRLCAVYNPSLTETTAYFYDAEGRRIAKGTPNLTVNPLSCINQVTNQVTLQGIYILGQSGEQISELNSSGALERSHVYANGQLLATYVNGMPEFPFGDWLGTKRVIADASGAAPGTCTSLFFGDLLSCTNASVSGHHFTGQIHDQETDNDYFGARYYSNITGRFLSPDWSSDPDTIPYAEFENPPTLVFLLAQ